MTIKVTLEFQTEDEVVRYFARDKVQITMQPEVLIKPKATRRTTPKIAPNAAPKEFVAQLHVDKEGHIQAELVKPAPVKGAEKKPNTPVQAVAVTVAEVNEAAVRAALREVVNTKSMKAAAEILKGFGATSISQIKPEQYAEFIKACKL